MQHWRKKILSSIPMVSSFTVLSRRCLVKIGPGTIKPGHEAWKVGQSSWLVDQIAFLYIQHCRVPKNGLPKNGLPRRTARLEFHLKNNNDPRLEKLVQNGFTTRKRLLWRPLLRRHWWLRNDSTSTVWSISAAFPVRHASSRTVCALQANLCDSKTDWKIRTRLAGIVKNKNDPGWYCLPPVLRHPTVL